MNKMDSDYDIFSSQGPRNSRYDKGWLILFHWSPHKHDPFQAYLISQFPESDIRRAWIENVLTAKWRKRRLNPLSILPGETLSLFAKVESGKKNYIFIIYPEVQS